MVTGRGSLRKERPSSSSLLVFLNKDGNLPIVDNGEFEQLVHELDSDPKTAGIMLEIKAGPNAVLFQDLVEEITTRGLHEEEEARLLIATVSLFFGKVITDAHMESWIKIGTASGSLKALSEPNFLDLNEVSDPSSVLLRERVGELQRGEFRLPRNPEELNVNVIMQAGRILNQVLDGTLGRKSEALGLQQQSGSEVGLLMVQSLLKLPPFFP